MKDHLNRHKKGTIMTYLIAAGIGFVVAGPLGVLAAVVALFCLNFLMKSARTTVRKG